MGDTFKRAEHSKWIKKKKPIMENYLKEMNGLLDNAANRGFAVVPGNVHEKVMNLGLETKKRLTQENGELYNEQKGSIFQQEEFDLNLLVDYARLKLQLYIQRLLNALELEWAELKEAFRKAQWEDKKLRAIIEKRNADLILAEARTRAEVFAYRTQLEQTKLLTLDKELELIQAQYETAQERLKIIPYLEEVIKAEQLVIEAEQRRVIVLNRVIEIEEELAIIKEGLIPKYKELAAKKEEQAKAIEEEAYWKKLMIELGYRETELKDTEAAAQVSQTEAEEALENARLAYVRAQGAAEIARAKAQTTLSQFRAYIARTITEIGERIKKADIDLRLDTAFEKLAMAIEDETEIQDERQLIIQAEKLNQIFNLGKIADYQYWRIRECAHKSIRERTVSIIDHKIQGGGGEEG